MSEAFVPGNFNVSVNQTNPKEAADGPTEDLDYYGWRAVIAACLGVMAGFGSLFVYTFSVFVKPLAAEFGWSREGVSSGFAIAAIALGLISSLLGRLVGIGKDVNSRTSDLDRRASISQVQRNLPQAKMLLTLTIK